LWHAPKVDDDALSDEDVGHLHREAVLLDEVIATNQPPVEAEAAGDRVVAPRGASGHRPGGRSMEEGHVSRDEHEALRNEVEELRGRLDRLENKSGRLDRQSEQLERQSDQLERQSEHFRETDREKSWQHGTRGSGSR
jgi:hypothetical protein